MPSPATIALTVGPLAAYLYILAIWHGGRRPKVVAGPVDFAFLAAGVGGVLVFGPFGRAAGYTLFGSQSPWSSAGVMAALALVALPGLLWSRRRLAIYHVDPDDLDAALRSALAGGRFARTLGGYEDAGRSLRLTVTGSRRLRSGSVEASGPGPEAIAEIAAIRPRLDEELAIAAESRHSPRASPVAWTLLAASALTWIVPIAALAVTQPKAREAMRALFQRLGGG